MPEITISNLKVTIPALPGHSLLISIINGFQPIHTICGGKGQCGCCRIQILSDRKGLSPVKTLEEQKLGPDKIKQGWRLACQTHTLRDVTLYLPPANELESHCAKSSN